MGDIAANPIRGNDGAFFAMKAVDAVGAADELDGHVKKVELDNEDIDGPTFAEIKQGLTKEFLLKVTALIDLTTGSFWRLLWDNPSAEFEVVYGPYGNAIASADKPHIKGVVKAEGKPKTSQEARTGRQREEFEYELRFVGEVELDEGV